MPSDFGNLSSSQQAALKKGGISSLSDLILAAPQDIARKCRISPSEANLILDSVSKLHTPRLITLKEALEHAEETFTTGDSRLDDILGGGLRTRMLWELVGESAAGKTQLALQLSLTVQLSPEQGGISGSTCYLITSGHLPTTRLAQIATAFEGCSLDDVHTFHTHTPDMLVHVLSTLLPTFLKQPRARPVRLLVIDAIAEFFHVTTRTTTQTLGERAGHLTEISALLHVLAREHGIAVLVLNEVVDVFDRPRPQVADPTLVLYSDVVPWFSRGHSVPGEDRKEAALGLVWANQVNARIMLTRTGRRRYVDNSQRQRTRSSRHDPPPSLKESENVDPELIRRLSLVFSSVSPPASIDYLITPLGFETLEDDSQISTRANEERKEDPRETAK